MTGGITWRDAFLALALAALWLSLVRPGPISLPYFWDAADVYVPGSLWVAENGLDVTPPPLATVGLVRAAIEAAYKAEKDGRAAQGRAQDALHAARPFVD